MRLYHYGQFSVHIYQRNPAPTVQRDRVRRACDDRERDDAKYIALDFKSMKLGFTAFLIVETIC